MKGYNADSFRGVEFSVAMTGELDVGLGFHLYKGPRQEDLTFAYWKPSRGSTRYTAILCTLAIPADDERVLQGNVAFTADYLGRVIRECPDGHGIALLHSHLGPGWQDMSRDDEFAEGVRMGGAVASSTGLPVLGLTRATDGVWSARFWLRTGRNLYTRADCLTVRAVDSSQLRISFHPKLKPPPQEQTTQVATISVWGREAQADVARTHVGIVGLGSVGSIVSEGLSRTGVEEVTYLDHDVVELRNLDRTLGAIAQDATDGTSKVDVAKRLAAASHTAASFRPRSVDASLLTPEGLATALDCDALICCVDRPWPRAIMNLLAYSHLIPVVDGGILAAVGADGRPLHVDWRIQTVSAGRACLYCLGALRRSDVALDRAGKLDDPDYLRGLSQADREQFARRNVFAFSLATAAHQIQQFVGLVTGMVRIGGKGPQHYSVYPGQMTVDDPTECEPDCEVGAHTATVVDFSPWLQPVND